MHSTTSAEQELSQQIKQLIKRLNISYEELSIQTDIPIATLNRMLKNPYNAKLGNIIKLFNELGTPLCFDQ